MYETRTLRLRHLASRIVGPVAVEADDAPLDPPGRPDDAGVLTDRIMQRALAAVGDMDDAGAERRSQLTGGYWRKRLRFLRLPAVICF